MPSATFFRLPAEKQEKLLSAAREEFAQVSFADASINQIIRRAGISRGAFYLYFKDKDDLFHYLLDVYIQQVMDWFQSMLERCRGDLFAALPALFDQVAADSHARPEVYANAVDILRNNTLLHVELLSERAFHPEALLSKIDVSRLHLEGPHDLELILIALANITGRALKACILSEEPAQVRIRYMETLEILKRGMVNTPVPCQ